MTPAGTTPPPAPFGGFTFRRWAGFEDIAGMVAANNRLRQHVGVLEPVDEAGMGHRYATLVNSEPRADCLVAEREGEIVGYGRIEWQDWLSGERIWDLTLVAEPSTWGTGLAEAIVAWCERRCLDVAAALPPTEREERLLAFELGGNEELTRVLHGMGYREVRRFAEMLRDSLDGVESPAVPSDYELRSPEEHELPAVWTSLIEAFAEHWGERTAEEQDPVTWWGDPRFRRDLVVVAWWRDPADPGAPPIPAAAVTGYLDADRGPEHPPRGLVESVLTLPEHRRQGLAEATILELLGRLQRAGATSAYLDVDTSNATGALRLYERCGFRTTTVSRAYARPLAAATRTP